MTPSVQLTQLLKPWPSVQLTQLLKPSELSTALKTCFAAERAPMIHGIPGIGKSLITRQVADQMYAAAYGTTVEPNGDLRDTAGNLTDERPWFRDIRAALLDAVDLRGLPAVNGDGRAHFAEPEFLPRDSRGGIFFLDEINRGSTMVMNGCFSLVLDGRLGEYVLPANWICAAAVNDLDIGAAKMSSALLARFIHLDATTDLDDVCRFAIDRGWEPVTIAFLRFRPELLSVYDRAKRVTPNPRAWEFISQITAQQPAPNVEHALFAGAIGDEAAIEYSAFLRQFRTLPSIDAIVLDPKRAAVSADAGVNYAVAVALSRRANEGNFARILTYLERMPVEYNVLAIKEAAHRTPELQSRKEFTAWTLKHSDVTF
jgi:MoxR-like ATPase